MCCGSFSIDRREGRAHDIFDASPALSRRGVFMSNDIAHLLYQGAVAVRAGRLADGQALLMQVVEHDENNELAWLWLSGAMSDPADQQVALENVLAINPDNQAAKQGLAWLQQQYGTIGAEEVDGGGEWSPPPPHDAEEVEELACWQCGASLYSVAQFCWQCHAAVHCCNNCAFRLEKRCKELQGLTNAMVQASRNECAWWRVQQG